MTGYAHGAERLLSGVQVGTCVGRQRQAGQVMSHISRDVLHAGITKDFTPGRHCGHATTHDCGLDGVGVAAPAPAGVRQVREAESALGIRAVADRAIGGKQATAHFQR
ncbi:hypothetical protein D3C87_1760410 [compost metagenome]